MDNSKIDNMSRYKQLAIIYFFAEFFGTFMLVIVGDGSVAAYVLTRQQVDMLAVCMGFGVGAMIATFLSAKISGAHINPAATLAFAIDGTLPWKFVPIYMIAQYAGGFVAAVTLLVNYAEAINYIDGGTRSAFGFNSTGSIFATYPAPYLSNWGGLLDQIVGTGVLLFSLSAVTDEKNMGLEQRHQPLVVAFVIGLICVAFSPNCGAIFNPARDLAPRIATAIFGYRMDVFKPLGGNYWWISGVVGPHIGAILGVLAYKYCIARCVNIKQKFDPKENNDQDQRRRGSQEPTSTKFDTTLQAM